MKEDPRKGPKIITFLLINFQYNLTLKFNFKFKCYNTFLWTMYRLMMINLFEFYDE